MNSGRLFPSLCLRRKPFLPGVSGAAGKQPASIPPLFVPILFASLVAALGLFMYLSARQAVMHWVVIAKVDQAEAYSMLNTLALAAAALTAAATLFVVVWIAERRRLARANERERKRMDERLRAGEEGFRQAFEHATARIRHLSQLKAAISEINRVIIHNQVPGEVFSAVCRACVDHGCFRLAWIGVADCEAHRIVPIAIAGPAAAYLEGMSIGTSADVPEGRGPTAVAYREERVYICNDFSADPITAPWRERARAHGLASSIALPLPRGGKPFGTLSVYGPDKNFFDAEAIALLREMADNVSFAIDQFDRETLRSSLSHRLVAVQEDERRRLAAQLHECLSPNLAAIKIMLATLSASLSDETRTPIIGHIEDAQALLDDTTADVRNICAELRPTLLDYAGLIPALHGYAALVMKHTAVAVHVSTPEDGTRLDAEIESTLFRIAQEALANCARHACAKNVFVELAVLGPDVVLTVKDDGFGFDANALERSGAASGLGLITMKERAEFAGGRFALSAHPLEGTEIRVELFDAGRLYPEANPSRSPQAQCGWSSGRSISL